MRIDKLLSSLGLCTRSEIKEDIKKGLVKVNSVVVKDSSYSVDENKDEIIYKEKKVSFEKYVYYILNKPQGVITATKDNYQKTVMDLIDDKRSDLSPVGRLDKDTEGLLIITNDGKLLHDLMSPKKHVSKTYFAHIDGKVTEKEVEAFKIGLDIGDENITLPSILKVEESGKISKIYVTIYEGRYHQVKRMFEAVNMKVLYLKRVAIGDMYLDDRLELGNYTKISKDELLDKIYHNETSNE